MPTYNPIYGCPASDLDATVDDEGPDAAIEDQCSLTAPAISGVAPGGDPPDTSLLSAFDGENSQGTWELTVRDHSSGATGLLYEWCLEARTAEVLREPEEVPVLDRAGAVVLVLLFVATGAWAIRRRRRV